MKSGQADKNAEHNMLEVTTAGQMAAIDLRFVKSYFKGKNIPMKRLIFRITGFLR